MNSFILVRYALLHVAFWLGVVWAVVSGVLLCGDIFEMVRRTGGSASFVHILSLASLKIPSHTDHFLPFISFVAARIALWRLHKRREMTALSAIGVSGFFWMRTLGLLVLALGLLHLLVLQPISSTLQSTWSAYEGRWLNQRSNYRFAVSASGLWLREDTQSGYRIIQAKQMAENKLHSVTIYEWSDRERFRLYIEAEEALLGQQFWELKNVKTVTASGEVTTSEASQLETTLTWDNVISTQMDPRSLSIWRVGEWLPLLKQVGISDHPYLMQWHRHIAQVGLIAALLFWALAIASFPLVGMLSGLIIYFAHDVVQALGQAQHIPIMLSAWCVPLVVMLVSAGWVVHHEEKL